MKKAVETMVICIVSMIVFVIGIYILGTAVFVRDFYGFALEDAIGCEIFSAIMIVLSGVILVVTVLDLDNLSIGKKAKKVKVRIKKH